MHRSSLTCLRAGARLTATGEHPASYPRSRVDLPPGGQRAAAGPGAARAMPGRVRSSKRPAPPPSRCSGSWQCCWNETAGAYWFVPGTCGAAERGYEAPAHSLRVMAFPRCNTHTVIFLLSEPLANSLRIMAFPRSSAGTVNQAHTGRKQVRFGTDGHGERRGIWR